MNLRLGLIAFLLAPSVAFAQAAPAIMGGANPTGSGLVAVSNANVVSLSNIAAGDLVGNSTGSSAAPADTTLTALIDQAFGSTQGSILYRGASTWTVLGPGSSGNFLETLGAGANPTWAPTGAAGSGCPTSSPCTTQQTINDATANRYGLIFGPATLASGTTGHGLNFVDTVNDASAVDGILWFSNTACTTCTSTSYLIDMQVASATVFRVSTSGGVFATASIQAGSTGSFNYVGRGAMSSPAASVLSNGALSATPSQTQWTGQGGSGTNIAGGAAVYVGGQGTGTGTPGTASLGTSITGTTGATLQASFQKVLTVDANQHISFISAAVPTAGTGTSAVTAGSTDAAGSFTTGTTVTSAALNFKIAYATAPFCTVIDQTATARLTSYTVSTSAITATMTSNTNDVLVYICHGA